MTLNRSMIMHVIEEERAYQDKKWGTLEQHGHEVGSWVAIMHNILNKATQRWATEEGDTGALDEIRKLVAVGFACMEEHGIVQRINKEKSNGAS